MKKLFALAALFCFTASFIGCAEEKKVEKKVTVESEETKADGSTETTKETTEVEKTTTEPTEEKAAPADATPADPVPADPAAPTEPATPETK